MAVKPKIAEWTGINASDPITTTATPPASGDLLREAIGWPLTVSTTPYCGCSHMCWTDHDPSVTYTDRVVHDRFWGVPVAPGATHARLWLGRAFWDEPGGATPEILYGPAGHTNDQEYWSQHQSSTTRGGDSHPNISVGPVAMPGGKGTTAFFWGVNKPRHKAITNDIFGTPFVDVVVTGEEIDDSPSGPLPRQLELEALRRAKIEPFFVNWVSTATAWVSRQDDDMGA